MISPIFFYETKTSKDGFYEWDSEGGNTEEYEFIFQKNGNVQLVYLSKCAIYNYTSNSVTEHFTTYFGSYSITNQNENATDVTINLDSASCICKCVCTFRPVENHSYENKSINEICKLTIHNDGNLKVDGKIFVTLNNYKRNKIFL